jgi:hypothetical protein
MGGIKQNGILKGIRGYEACISQIRRLKMKPSNEKRSLCFFFSLKQKM